MNTTKDEPSSMTGLVAADHSEGSPNAAVLLLEYGDYECPSCAEAEPYTRHLVDAFGGRMRFVFRHYPLVASHPHAELAAEAAEAAAAQGHFWEMHRQLFANQRHLRLSDLTHHAEAIGLDTTRFAAEMSDRIYTQRVQEHRRSGDALGLRASPSFFLDGVLIDVSFGFERLEHAVRIAVGEIDAD
jgi:protein-disulfide isomerase